jgi:hypothetical protein
VALLHLEDARVPARIDHHFSFGTCLHHSRTVPARAKCSLHLRMPLHRRSSPLRRTCGALVRAGSDRRAPGRQIAAAAQAAAGVPACYRGARKRKPAQRSFIARAGIGRTEGTPTGETGTAAGLRIPARRSNAVAGGWAGITCVRRCRSGIAHPIMLCPYEGTGGKIRSSRRPAHR